MTSPPSALIQPNARIGSKLLVEPGRIGSMVFFFFLRVNSARTDLNRPKNPRAEALFDSAEEEIFFCTRDAMDTRA